MPVNNTAIPPSEGPTGTTHLPFSRIKRIIAADSEIQIMSNAGVFVITLATEMFIQHLAKQAHIVVKSERKPRRTIQYKDLATAVSTHDNLEFLVDIVPKTIPFKEIKAKKATATTSSSSKAQDHGKQEADQSSLSKASSMLSDSNKYDKNIDSDNQETEDTNKQACSTSNQVNEESGADLA